MTEHKLVILIHVIYKRVLARPISWSRYVIWDHCPTYEMMHNIPKPLLTHAWNFTIATHLLSYLLSYLVLLSYLFSYLLSNLLS